MKTRSALRCAVTVDFDTLDDQAVTIRERDTMQQERVSLDKVADYIAERIGEKRVSVPQMPVEMGGEAWPESVKIAEARWPVLIAPNRSYRTEPSLTYAR